MFLSNALTWSSTMLIILLLLFVGFSGLSLGLAVSAISNTILVSLIFSQLLLYPSLFISGKILKLIIISTWFPKFRFRHHVATWSNDESFAILLAHSTIHHTHEGLQRYSDKEFDYSGSNGHDIIWHSNILDRHTAHCLFLECSRENNVTQMSRLLILKCLIKILKYSWKNGTCLQLQKNPRRASFGWYIEIKFDLVDYFLQRRHLWLLDLKKSYANLIEIPIILIAI